MIHTQNDAITAERTLDRLYSDSDYRYPRDFQPSICGLNGGTDAILRRLICAGAQWLHDNPNEPLDGQKFEEFIQLTDAFVGHSASSYGAVVNHLSAVKDKGFDGYIAEMREQSKEAAVVR